ncbi:hypothetical protein EW15_0089 [Prochlorococcus sp. MIT 0801]|nr:hypothetical protein EW15_0089 [Prochlorococcus sp. MIT 0801]
MNAFLLKVVKSIDALPLISKTPIQFGEYDFFPFLKGS